MILNFLVGFLHVRLEHEDNASDEVYITKSLGILTQRCLHCLCLSVVLFVLGNAMSVRHFKVVIW